MEIFFCQTGQKTHSGTGKTTCSSGLEQELREPYSGEHIKELSFQLLLFENRGSTTHSSVIVGLTTVNFL
jgi:hypothetical protein